VVGDVKVEGGAAQLPGRREEHDRARPGQGGQKSARTTGELMMMAVAFDRNDGARAIGEAEGKTREREAKMRRTVKQNAEQEDD
jgi:hypothetical protein